MASQLVECVPNISEGRDHSKIQLIVEAVQNTPGCTVLGVEPDHDYHRTVITFAGEPHAVANGAVALIEKSIELLDMRTHRGEHPRLGVVDVCPFVPLRNITMEECAALAKDVVDRLAQRGDVPLFLYGHAAVREERTMLSHLRKEEYEGLRSRLDGGDTSHTDATRWPDEGAREWSDVVARTGGITVGARSILVAYNVNINEKGGALSKKIGSIVRSSGRLLKSANGGKIRSRGMLSKVQGMGVPVDELGISQVSMNLLDVDVCPLHLAFKTCESLASDHNTALCGSEIVGLVPLKAMLEAGRFFNPTASTDREMVDAAMNGLGLNVHHSFDPELHIIEWALAKEASV
jgi:glutamate formiminotransferase/formiminotetrahydrofolate cyclodeaminase